GDAAHLPPERTADRQSHQPGRGAAVAGICQASAAGSPATAAVSLRLLSAATPTAASGLLLPLSVLAVTACNTKRISPFGWSSSFLPVTGRVVCSAHARSSSQVPAVRFVTAILSRYGCL